MPEKLSFYIVAHADDWQLFMQPNAYNDLVAEDSKVVFIVTTAGDAGMDKTYWSAREEGTKSSIRFCLAPITTLNESSGTKNLNNHNISYYTINNSTTYFLRLPDGHLNGKGFQENQYQSLTQLRHAAITTITSVDQLETYKGWQDFCETLQSIIVSHTGEITNAVANYLSPDPIFNPTDHADHIATAQALQAIAVIARLKQRLFIGYSSMNNKEKLHGTDLFWKSGMFAAYEKAVYDACGYSTLKETVNTYAGWCLSNAICTKMNPLTNIP